ncbi:MAG TPA: SpoIIE family protein phosphatase [Ignavibacteriaceae bacterium]|nr:SpoIIE family protein phosphatase [Ignavibacteriaceae bacterium]
MNITKDIKMEVMGVHNLFWESYARRDIELRFSLCAEDVTFIGSGLYERALNKTEYKNINKEGVKQFPDPFQIEFSWTYITMLSENVACVESEVVWSQLINDEMFKELLRNTTLLKRDNSKWLVTHVHGSVPDYRLKDGDYMTNEQTIIRNRELERQVYERTQDLNKTLGELEQKNRELEIEASLERVRAVAMSMNKSEDLLGICEVSFKEFKKLGFDNIRNALIHIQDDEQKYFMDYDFSDLTGGAITKIEYGSHPIVEDYLKQIRSAEDAFYQGVIKEDQLEEWKNFRKNSGQIDDPRLDNATALYYYFFSIGVGDIGISTLQPIDESQIKILKRFRNVFDLAYRRYNDITLAEAQAREAQIELELERVRARTMAMQSSNELKEVVANMFDGLKSLSVDPTVCNISLIDKKTCDSDVWSAHQTDNSLITYRVFISHFEHPFRKKLIDSFLNKISFSVHELSGDLKKSYIQYLIEHVDYSKVPDEVTKSNEKLVNIEEGIVLSAAYMKYGLLIVSRNLAISNDESDILQRFAKIFEQTYTRFLDLQKAEAQAREAKIEASMEKIRSRSLAMQKPGELVEVAELLRKEMGLLGVEELETSSIYIVDEENQKAECWYAIKDIREENKRLVSDEMTLTLSDTWVGNEMWKFYRSKEGQISIVMKGDNRKEWINDCANKSKVLQGYYGNEIPERTYHLVKFNGGYMGAASPGDISSESWDFLKRAAAVFSLAYTRFKDLQEAEASAREAQIEAALERVRSRTMGMQKSIELKDVIRVVYEQFVHLKINVGHAGFVVDYTPKGDWHFWIADEQDIPSKITHPYFESVWAKQFNVAKEKGADFFATNLNFEEKNKFYNELLSHVHGLPEASKDFYLSCPGLAISTVLLENVGLYIENFSGIPYSDEENNMLMRFGKVFQQTYTRFLDLQKAEAQSKEAKIEAALEKVRAVALSLKKSDEMLDIAQALYEQLLELGFTNIRNAIIDLHNDSNETFWDYDYSHDMGKTITLMTYHDDPIIEKQVRQIESSSDAFFELILEGQDLQDLIDMRLRNGENEDPRLRQIEQLTYNLYSFGNGAIGISNFGLLSDEQKIVLKRFRNVFAFAYKRYNDLFLAETQAREAKIEASLEKVRASAMSMHKSDELLGVCEILYKELNKLGFDEMRNTMINIHNDEKEAFINYDYSDEIGKSINHLTYNIHPVIEKQIKQIRSTNDAFSETSFTGKDLEEWKKFRQNIGEKDDPRINEISALYYYFYSIGAGSIGLSTFSSINEEKLELLKRFRNVFSLSYQRYADIALAEAQAREAKIEASLERVRSKAMAMHSPNDLSDTVNVFFKELKTLGIIPIRCGVGQIDEATRTTSLTTTTSSQQGESFQVIGKVKQTGHPVLDGIFDHWKLQQEYHPVLEGDDIKAYYNVMNAQIGYPEYPKGVTQYGNNFFFNEGFVFAWTEHILSQEELVIFRRFTSVLSLTYRRYLDLKEAEERNNIIQADNERKTKELEEARQLQLSLLPRTLPQLPQFDIAVYMKTATEVGGDYYDFKVQENGVLNIGIGDATGHGLQAGTMITLMKGFFTSDAAKFNPQKFLEHCNGMIREIKLGRILMSFSHLRFENSHLLISSAGMPPVYYHHKKNNRTEEIIIQGLPLGAMRNASYKLVEKQLCSGDTILLLTDGLPEQMNSHKVPFDYSRVQKYFGEIADNSPKDIINRLVQKADDWMDGQKQSDDVTFVVIKVK